MLRRPDRFRLGVIGVILVALATFTAGAAQAAKLVGGREQSAVLRAFKAQRSHRRAVVVSVRASTVARPWLVAKWVKPSTSGIAGSVPSLHSAYFHLVGGAARPGSPPGNARRDLQARFRVAIAYSGTGTETVNYPQTDKTVCIGNGQYLDQQQETVDPMAWTVRYVIDLDHLQAAVGQAPGTAVVPTVSFDRRGSQLTAAETLSRTTIDTGCSQRPTTIRCTTSDFLDVRGAGSDVSFVPGRGTQIGIPLGFGRHGDCAPDDYTLGPSLWDSGAATAGVSKLDLAGGRLPPNPYAPLRVSWPFSAAGVLSGFLVSPCQGLATACSDAMRWSGTVRLLPGS
ncbi:MAG: hypothetical protein ACRDNK_10760 [Solirubrobacteraceae bacterium]